MCICVTCVSLSLIHLLFVSSTLLSTYSLSHLLIHSHTPTHTHTHTNRQILTKNHGNANERWLWHGTNNTDPAKIWDGMNACGFDPRFGSGYYGNGAYFAVKAKYSDSYAYRKSSEGRKMFLASVICGESKNYGTTLAKTLKRQPQLPSSHRRYPDSYDSVLAGPHSGSCMYVIYECEQAMPMYMVSYK